MSGNWIPLFAAAIALTGVILLKTFDIASEISRRRWDDRQKMRLKRQDATTDLLRAAVEAVSRIEDSAAAAVTVDVHVAVLRMRALGAGRDLIQDGDAILLLLAQGSETGKVDIDLFRKVLSKFADGALDEFFKN